MPDAHLLDDYVNGTRRRSTDVALCSQALHLASCDRQLDIGSVCITLLQRMKGWWGVGGWRRAVTGGLCAKGLNNSGWLVRSADTNISDRFSSHDC